MKMTTETIETLFLALSDATDATLESTVQLEEAATEEVRVAYNSGTGGVFRFPIDTRLSTPIDGPIQFGAAEWARANDSPLGNLPAGTGGQNFTQLRLWLHHAFVRYVGALGSGLLPSRLLLRHVAGAADLVAIVAGSYPGPLLQFVALELAPIVTDPRLAVYRRFVQAARRVDDLPKPASALSFILFDKIYMAEFCAAFLARYGDAPLIDRYTAALLILADGVSACEASYRRGEVNSYVSDYANIWIAAVVLNWIVFPGYGTLIDPSRLLPSPSTAYGIVNDESDEATDRRALEAVTDADIARCSVGLAALCRTAAYAADYLTDYVYDILSSGGGSTLYRRAVVRFKGLWQGDIANTFPALPIRTGALAAKHVANVLEDALPTLYAKGSPFWTAIATEGTSASGAVGLIPALALFANVTRRLLRRRASAATLERFDTETRTVMLNQLARHFLDVYHGPELQPAACARDTRWPLAFLPLHVRYLNAPSSVGRGGGSGGGGGRGRGPTVVMWTLLLRSYSGWGPRSTGIHRIAPVAPRNDDDDVDEANEGNTVGKRARLTHPFPSIVSWQPTTQQTRRRWSGMPGPCDYIRAERFQAEWLHRRSGDTDQCTQQ